jgi:hypothetical protein
LSHALINQAGTTYVFGQGPVGTDPPLTPRFRRVRSCVVPVPRRDLLFQHRFDAGYSHAALLAQRAKQSAGEPAIKPLLIGLRQLFLLLHVRVSRSFDGGDNFATGNQCKATNIGTPS